MRDYVWLTNPSDTEGVSTVYVDSVFGNDIQGNGKRTAPYKTLTKAWTANSTKPSTIVCRGLFSEQMTEGTHSTTIVGDYYGAATFDGQGKYLLYGYSHKNLIILNATSDSSAPVYTNSTAFRGVGRANRSDHVGRAAADHLCGVVGPSIFLGKSDLYWGVIGGYEGNNGVRNSIYWKPTCRKEDYLLALGTLATPSLNYCTVYDAGFDEEGLPSNRRKNPFDNINSLGSLKSTILAKTVIILNDNLRINYIDCLFTADTKYYYFDGNDASNGYTEVSLEGIAKEDRGQYLIDQLTALYTEKSIATNKQYFPKFTNCIFSDQTSEEIFNNPELGDMTLIPGCDADIDNNYVGALPPAKNIPIMDDSTGYKETWDERSASGCVVVSDNKIYIDPNSESDRGSILSKIITINPKTTQLNGIYSLMQTKWHDKYILGSNEPYTVNGENAIYTPTEFDSTSGVLPTGLYMVIEGSVPVDDVEYSEGEAFKVTTSDFSIVGNGKVIQILEPNAGDVLYCRCRSAIYNYVESGEALARGATYLNVSGGEITYHGRTIANGESFVCMTDSETASAKLAVVFDDDGVPPSEWVPARFWGEYYVGKENGAIKYDAYGIPYGTGNARTWKQTTLYKSTLDRKYVQFKIEVTKL